MLTSAKTLGLRHKLNLCSLLCCHSLAQTEPSAGQEGCDLSLLQVTKGDVAFPMAGAGTLLTGLAHACALHSQTEIFPNASR